MQSPEILLKDLNHALRELYGATQLLPDERLQEELPLLMRKLLLAEVLGDTSIVAIGGSQGAGKTTLLRSLYAVADEKFEWLDPNEGRGEMLPVLIEEDAALERPQGYVRRLAKKGTRYETVPVKVDVPEFRKAVCDPDPGDLLPVLRVPQRYFTRTNQAWLLLPGYEPQKRENKSWQELMRQALIGATGCVVVTDETRMANQEQVRIVNDMLSNELRGAEALVVISKTEGIKNIPERLQELRATAATVFGVAPERTERWIICTGSDDAAYIDTWLPRMRDAIDMLARSRGGDRQAQLNRLQAVLSRDLTTVLGLVASKTKLLFQQREGGADGPLEVVESCLTAFDDASSELREAYQDGVTSVLDAQFDAAWLALQEHLKDDHEGMWNGVKDFFKSATESQQYIEGHIEHSWSSPRDLMKNYAVALGTMTAKKLNAPTPVPSANEVLQCAAPVTRLAYGGAAHQPVQLLSPDENDMQNLQFVLAGRNHPASESPRATIELERSIKLLPTLALECVRLGALMPGLIDMTPATAPTGAPQVSGERADRMQQSVQQLGDGVALGQTLVRSLALVLAVDVATDGDIDIVSTLASAFGGTATTAGGTTATGAAATIGGVGAAVVGVVAVSYLVYSAMRATRAQDERARVIAHGMLMSIKDHHQRHFTRQFKLLMDQVRARLRQSLRERYRLDESLLEKDRLAVSIGNVRALQRDLLDQIGRSGHSLQLFNAEAAA